VEGISTENLPNINIKDDSKQQDGRYLNLDEEKPEGGPNEEVNEDYQSHHILKEECCHEEHNETTEINEDHLKLAEDFYAVTYIGYLKTNIAEYSLTKDKRNDSFKRCLYIFGLQIVLVGLMFFTILNNNTKFFTLCTFDVFLARYICAILLHIQLQGEVGQAISMIKYLGNH